MNNVFKKVLIYLGVGALGAFIGIGVLIGVSSCAYKQDNNTQEKAKLQPKGKKLDRLTDELIATDKHFYFRAKSYATDGKGTFYTGDSITLHNSHAVSSDWGIGIMEFTLLKENGNTDTHYFNFVPQLDTIDDVFRLRRVTIDGVGYIYDTDSGVFNRQICAFVGYNLVKVIPNSSTYSRILEYINIFFDVYDMTEYEEVFTFDDNFNFNNFWYNSTDGYAQMPYAPVLPVARASNQTLTYNLGVFYSNGLAFDAIEVEFDKAYYMYFQSRDNESEWLQYEGHFEGGQEYLFFASLYYVNRATNFRYNVCSRAIGVYQPNTTYYSVYFKPVWNNVNFKEIHFDKSVTNLTYIQILNGVNNGSVINGFAQVSTDVGIGNVFTLLSQAFTAWTPIFAIQIVPGITIGLLLFLPLIAGVIVLIIWVVKR